ncbi:hypothetical protein HHL16_23465 [Pseudoflavitalea sp. G-6-1-2]|uniref:hypothetical protein n=1 Tax=Pseudoflavitalea sp. G-6-1-2 TaxID=2728841 RepID=UPI00146C63C1|nr:hypothetical protein [Pseudoflavitalea sp. G-6-1-2]NML23859.1 hypothetical protein [Pseudoflavitalea sp. G-6-1-2]
MKSLFVTMLICGAISTFGQAPANCNQIKAELEKIKQENEYLKNSLKINKPVYAVTSDNIEFKLLKAEGNSKSQSITFTFVLTTSAANWYINSDIRSIIDLDGNEYKLKSYTLGAEDYGSSIKLNTGVPIKCTYTFGGILPAVKMIKLFKFDYTHSWGEPFNVEFRDIPIDWK